MRASLLVAGSLFLTPFWGCGSKNTSQAAVAPSVPQAEATAPEGVTVRELGTNPPPNLTEALLQESAPAPYRIGVEDLLDITVHGNPDLATSQMVRPDGMIAFPLVGDVTASGVTPDELREEIASRLSRFIRNPSVNVVVTEYNSKRVVSLGELRTPGVLRLRSDIRLLEGISLAGGLTEEADLRGAVLIRDGEILPVSFEKLLRRGDLSQNALLRPNDVIFVPNVGARKIFVLGEVKTPLVIAMRDEVSLVESISLAGGLTRDAQPKSMLVIRGGLGNPEVLTIDFNAIVQKGDLAQNLSLEPGDIVYAPRSGFANVAEFFDRLRIIITPVVLAETLFLEARPVVVR